MTTPEASGPPPVTGIDQIDEALARLDLGEDVTTHPGELAAALEVLQRVLNAPSGEQ